MLPVGTEWIVDAEGCRAEALADVSVLRSLFARVVSELDLIVVGEAQWQKFPGPGGVTGLALLSESHLACHTYPEFGVATFNLYCCRARAAWAWEERLREALGAQVVTVRVVERPQPAKQNTATQSTATRDALITRGAARASDFGREVGG